MLLGYLQDTHAHVREIAKRKMKEDQQEVTSAHGGKLQVGDLVAVKQSGKDRPVGSNRFGWRTDGEFYRIREDLGQNTFTLNNLLGVEDGPGGEMRNKYSADRLIKLDMPEFDVESYNGAPSRLEIFDDQTSEWQPGQVEKMSVDGRMLIRFDSSDGMTQWMDLTRCRYRWLVGEVLHRAEIADEAVIAIEPPDL